MFIEGTPVPQGSKTVFNGRAVDANKKLKPWRKQVTEHAKWIVGPDPQLEGPLVLACAFIMPRPKSAPKSRVLPSVKPDVDKLIRSIGDSLTGIVYADDGQVTRIDAVEVYGEEPGVHIWVHNADQAEDNFAGWVIRNIERAQA